MRLPTIYLNCDDRENSWNKKKYLLAADDRLGDERHFRDIKESPEQPDYVLNIEPCSFKTGKVWTGIWEIDLIFDRAQTSESDWVVADDVLLAVSTIPERLERFRNKTTLLFQACDPTFNRRYPNIKPEYDFVICGSGGDFYKERERCYDILKEKFTYKGYDKGRTPQDYSRCLNTARVQFIRSANTVIADGEIAQRFFECLAIGPVLTNWCDDLENTGLVAGRDYLAYHDDEEMVKGMKKLLDPEFGKWVANNGRKKALLFHTYEHRIITILNTINEHALS